MITRDLSNSQRIKRRSLILAAVKSAFTLVVCGKLYYLQIKNKSKYGKLSDLNRTKVKILYPERGTIFDNMGNPIAANRSDFQLNIFREKKELINRYVSKLKNIIYFSRRDYEELKKNIKTKDLSDFIVIKKNLTWEELEIFELVSNKFPFSFITKEKVRSYENNLIFSHVLGYVGYKKDLKEQKLNNLKFGISGIEKTFDKKLLGTDGWIKLETNSKGRIKKELNKKIAIPGENINTSLIAPLQEKAYSLLSEIRGAAVVIDCKTGGVNCMVSTPSFDNDEFSNGVSSQKWNRLVIDESNPLLNRCVSGLYSPGSTYKLLIALFVLEKMGFNKNTKYFCPGFVEFGNRKFHCWKKEGHKSLDLSEAIKKSCDCYFYNLAKNINIDDLSSFSNQFSIGKLTDIDMPDESSGLMPDSKWKKKNRGEKWQRGETLNTVIGQGFTLSTPLQITLMTARIASGKNLQPKILKRNRYFFENINVSEKNLDFIRNSMLRVVNEFEGTAFRSRLQSGLKMAGKTGTSQVRRITKEERESGVLKNEELAYKLRDHSLFTGYAPYDNPRFAITVVAEHMGNGSKVAAPISKKIIDFALRSFS